MHTSACNKKPTTHRRNKNHVQYMYVLQYEWRILVINKAIVACNVHVYKITTELLYNDITPYNGVNCFVLFTDKNENKS